MQDNNILQVVRHIEMKALLTNLLNTPTANISSVSKIDFLRFRKQKTFYFVRKNKSFAQIRQKII